MEKHRDMTNTILTIILLLLIGEFVFAVKRFDRAVDRIEKAIGQYATPGGGLHD